MTGRCGNHVQYAMVTLFATNALHLYCPSNNHAQGSGGRLNIKMPSYQYRDSHVKDKTVSPTVLSLTWESPYLGKTVFILRQGPGCVVFYFDSPPVISPIVISFTSLTHLVSPVTVKQSLRIWVNKWPDITKKMYTQLDKTTQNRLRILWDTLLLTCFIILCLHIW